MSSPKLPEAPPVPAGAVAIFLDFDGTLVEIAATPRSVKVEASIRTLLTELSAALDGALAILTGRRLDSLDEFLAPPVLPAAGLHGAQLRLRADAPAEVLAPALPGVAGALHAQFREGDTIRVEDKGIAVALHFREAPERAAEAKAALEAAIAGHAGLEIIAGKSVFEARPLGFDKGTALRRFMQAPPFAGRRPIFFGDDRTDEDGMRVALELGGDAVKVGEGESLAPHRLADPTALHEWLLALLTELKAH